MPITLLCYPKCTTCKKAEAYLKSRGIPYTYRDIKLDNPTAAELAVWWKQSGLPLKRFFNTSGLVYKELALRDKLPAIRDEEQLILLATNGMLVKRPLLVCDEKVLVGFKESEWEAFCDA